MSISPAVAQWAQHRGISRSTLEALGVASDTSPKTGAEIIVFPYVRDGKVINRKVRPVSEKKFWMDKGGELRFFNLDAVLKGPQDVAYVVEGEMDCAALVEAGFPPHEVLSVPNGSQSVDASDENPETGGRYRWVDAGLAEGLSKVKRFVLVTDNDAKGQALRQDLVRLLGPARCWFVDFPEGIKDANDFLVKYGAADLRIYIEEDAKEWPVEGVYGLLDIPEPEPLVLWRPGFPEWNDRMAFAPKTVGAVTGHPGHGKTTLMMQIWFQICRDYNISGAIASFETRAKPHHRRNIRQFMFGRLERDLTDDQKKEADTWTHEHFRWLIHPNRKPTLRWILDTAEVAVVRNNCRFLQIDPWNRLEGTGPSGMRETDFIGQCLDELLDFANDLNVHVQVIAHPAKMLPTKDGKRPIPSLGDIAGSKQWDNKVDWGATVHRAKIFDTDGTRQTEAEFIVMKSRFDELGYPTRLPLNYSVTEGRFRAEAP